MSRAPEPAKTPNPLERLSDDDMKRHARSISREDMERALEAGRRDREALESTQRQHLIDPRIRFR